MEKNIEPLEHFKNVHKMWNGKKWKLKCAILGEGENSYTINNVLDDTYVVFKFDKNEKITRFVLRESSYNWESKHYSYTQEEKEMCYDDFVEKNGQIWFEWSYPYLIEILRDENGVKLLKSKWQIVEDDCNLSYRVLKESPSFMRLKDYIEENKYIILNNDKEYGKSHKLTDADFV